MSDKAPPRLQYSALLLLFKGFNTLDVNGPLEVFRKSGQSKYFSVTIAAQHDITESVEGALMQRHVALDEKLISEKSLSSYDILIVPGGGADFLDVQAADTKSYFMQAIKRYASLPPPAGKQRLLLGICVGSIFMGTMGVLNDPKIPYATTHWRAYSKLASTNLAAATSEGNETKPGTVIPARFVDSGYNSSGVRIITSGGISCGMDASLHAVKIMIGPGNVKGTNLGEEEAKNTANLLDYAWRQTDGVIFGRQY